ncbi:carboxypeptidase-like regulatory domain-containing protein [Flavobacterium okayamense]|uniref:carboxypeptidase-like regulatory domain-containing protein n=1 Tax=Flavobacterium okayamense TaxID=2830782 RepID=UPI001C85C2E7|nr:carboxypeptidase-like regulatory domain-containing protein [Flavobacterium okayamense]
MNRKLFFTVAILLLYIQSCFGQESFVLNGKVVSQSNNLEGIHVINHSKDIGITTDRGGYFSIKAEVSDTLIFSAVHLKGYMHIVVEDDKQKELLFVPMEAMLTELEEITLTKYQNITPEALGIIPKGMKKFTPAERKLAAAGDFRWYSPLLIPVGGMSVDGLVNAISGRTAMLKKELVVEKNEMLLENIKLNYDKEFITNRLKIPEAYVEGFYFYILDEQEFLTSFKTKNKTMSEFVLSKLASKYLELKEITNE